MLRTGREHLTNTQVLLLAWVEQHVLLHVRPVTPRVLDLVWRVDETGETVGEWTPREFWAWLAQRRLARITWDPAHGVYALSQRGLRHVLEEVSQCPSSSPVRGATPPPVSPG